MAHPEQPAAGQPAGAVPPVVVKKYANRRLYNTETSSYITLDNLAEMIRAGRDFVVYDAKSSEDITRGVLTQIIVEEESKGSAMLPTPFLRQLIGFYGDSLQGVVPGYLEQAMASFSRQQQQVRAAMSPFLPPGLEEMGRQNLAMIERAITMFNPFLRTPDPKSATEPASPTASPEDGDTAQPAAAHAEPGHADTEIVQLRAEIESLRNQLAVARVDVVMAQATAAARTPEPPHAPQAAPNVRLARPPKAKS